MLTPEEFSAEYPPETLAAELPGRPISSLRDVQYLYGKLYTLATAGGGDYAAYLTPDQARELVGEPDSLVVVRVDLSGDLPRLADDERGPVWVTKYTEDRIEPVAHSKYPAARGIDHSVTHQSGRNSDPEKLARYARERLTKWATDDVVQDVAEDHPDGDFITGLATLGSDEESMETVSERVQAELGGATTALLTVRVKTEANGEFRWPGEIDVYNEAMRQRKLSKLVSKGQADDAAGTATDFVSGERTRTVGTSEDPLNYYLGKQMETFPGLDPDESWRTHPISEDAAVTVMNAETFVEACSYSTFGATVYYLPYFMGQTTPTQAYELYGYLYNAVQNDDVRLTPVEQAYEQLRDRLDEEGTRLRFYVSAVMKHQMSRYDVFGETMNGTLMYPVELARAHGDILESSAYRQNGTEWTAPLPKNSSWTLLDENYTLIGPIAKGAYFAETFPAKDDTDASADDPRIQALVSVLEGDSIPVGQLLDAYVERLADADTDAFPSFRAASQFAQLGALASHELGLLHADDDAKVPITEPPTYDAMKEKIADGGTTTPQTKLETFIEATPALSGEENDQRRSAFLLGALVGAVGNYQEYHEERSTTLVDQFPIKSVTRTRVKKIAQETVGKTLTYTRQEKKAGQSYPGTKFDWLVDELRTTILQRDPDDWSIDTADLRFYYALGITYGMNDRPQSTDDEQPTDESDSNQ